MTMFYGEDMEKCYLYPRLLLGNTMVSTMDGMRYYEMTDNCKYLKVWYYFYVVSIVISTW